MCRLLMVVALSGLASSAAHAAEEAAIARGRALFEGHCAVCHGDTATAGEAGDIRGLPRSVVARATRGMEQMPAFAFSDGEIEALVRYLAHLWEQD